MFCRFQGYTNKSSRCKPKKKKKKKESEYFIVRRKIKRTIISVMEIVTLKTIIIIILLLIILAITIMIMFPSLGIYRQFWFWIAVRLHFFASCSPIGKWLINGAVINMETVGVRNPGYSFNITSWLRSVQDFVFF